MNSNLKYLLVGITMIVGALIFIKEIEVQAIIGWFGTFLIIWNTAIIVERKNFPIKYELLSKEELLVHHVALMKALNKIRNHESYLRTKNEPMKLASEVNKYVPKRRNKK